MSKTTELRQWATGRERLFREAREKNLLVLVCANCQEILGTKSSEGTGYGISHGICPSCVEELYPNIRGK